MNFLTFVDIFGGDDDNEPGFFETHPLPTDEIFDVSDVHSNVELSYGDPEVDLRYYHAQKYDDTCAIVCQEYILDTYLDRDFSEEELVLEAMRKGYYWPGVGTFPEYVGNLLEDYGVDIEKSRGNSIDDIIEKLNKKQKVIVCVDANEIWCPSAEEQLKDLLFLPQANHAVVVIGYDESSETVILNDPGHPNGGGLRVSKIDFENAWQDSDNFMVSTIYNPPVFYACGGAGVLGHGLMTVTKEIDEIREGSKKLEPEADA
jgi:hypothetical protein